MTVSGIPDWLNPVPDGDVGHGQLPGNPQQWDVLSEDMLRQMRERLLESILAVVVQALRGFFVPGNYGAAFDQLEQWARDVPIIGEVTAQIIDLLGDQTVGLLEALLGTYEGDDENLQLIETAFAPIRAIITAFTGLVGENLSDLVGFLGGLEPFDSQDPIGSGTRLIDQISTYIVSKIVENVIGLPGDLDALKTWVETNIPGMDVLVSTITGETTGSLDITQLGTWAKTILTSERSVPANMLSGSIPGNVFGTLPVSHISITNANLLSQGDFAAAGTITAGDGWVWDGNENRTGEGSGSAKVSCNSTLRVLYSNQTIPVVGRKTVNGLVVDGDKLRLSAYVKTSSDFAGSSSSINLAIIPFIGTTAQTPVVIAARGSTSNQWLGLSGTGAWVVPENVTSVRVRLAVTAEATAGSVWFDNVDLSKDGLLGQGLVEYLTDAWDDLIRASLGIPAGGAVNAATIQAKIQAMFAGFSSIGADAGTALTNANNAVVSLQTFLSNTPAQNFAALGQTITNSVNDFGTFLGNAAAGTAATVGTLVNGAITNATNAVNDFGKLINNVGQTITGGIVSTVEHVGQAIAGAIQGTIDTWNNFWGGVFGGTHTGKTATSVTQAAATLKSNTTLAQTAADQAKAANVSTNLAIYNGFFGYGGSGVVAETQATMAAIKTKLDSGYTLQTLTYNSGTKKQLIRVTDRPAGGVYQPMYKFTGSFTNGSSNVFPRVDCNATGPELAAVLQRSSTIGPGNADVTFFDRGYGNDYDVVLRPKVQNVAVSGTPTGGTFDLSFKGQTTAPIPYNASASDVQLALQNLSSTKASGSLALDGSGDFLGLPKVDLSQASSATIEFWFKLGSSGGGTVISNRTSTTIDYEISVSATGASITYGMSNGTSSTVNYSFTAPVGQWHHLAIVITRSSNTAAFLGYFNGSGGLLLGANSNSPVTNANTSGCMAIGASDWNNPSGYFNGKISNLRIVRSRIYTGSSYTVPTSSLTNITGTALLMFRDTGFEDALGTQFAYNGNAVASTDSPFSSSLGNVTVTGSPGSYTVTFGNEIPNVELMTASSSLTGGTNPSVLVTDANSYAVIGVYPYLLYSGGPLPKVSTLSYWDKPWPSDDVPKEFYAVCFGSGGGGGAGIKRVSNSLASSSYTIGGSGGPAGSYTAMELDASTIPSEVWYQVAGGGAPYSLNSPTPGSETTFGEWITTVASTYTVVDLLGYYTSNGSAPGSGGTGGAGYSASGNGVTGGTGGRSPLAAGGTGGNGSMVNGTTLTNIPSNGGVGADSDLTGKARAGGGGGGGGGGSWSQYANGSYLHTNPGGLGGNGGRPGGGGGGGGGAFTYDVNGVGAANMPNSGIAAGNGGYGGHGIIVLLWK